MNTFLKLLMTGFVLISASCFASNPDAWGCFSDDVFCEGYSGLGEYGKWIKHSISLNGVTGYSEVLCGLNYNDAWAPYRNYRNGPFYSGASLSPNDLKSIGNLGTVTIDSSICKDSQGNGCTLVSSASYTVTKLSPTSDTVFNGNPRVHVDFSPYANDFPDCAR